MSMFGKRDYVWLASVARDMSREETADEAVQVLADALESDSPGFNKELFLSNVYRPVESLDELFAEEEFRQKIENGLHDATAEEINEAEEFRRKIARSETLKSAT